MHQTLKRDLVFLKNAWNSSVESEYYYMIGIDIVYLPEFEKKIENSPLEKVFLSHELSQNKTIESLAGIFAAKEACFKAIGRKEDWLSVWIEKDKNGKPQLKTLLLDKTKKIETSISHSGEYAIAIVMIKDK